MTKKQYVLASFLAAVPAYGLIAAMLWAMISAGFLGDGSRVSAALWIVFILTFLGGLTIGILPFAVLIFPGLMPIAAMAGSPPAQPKDRGKSKPADDNDELSDSEEYEDSEEYSEEYSEDDQDSFDDESLEDFGDFEEEDDDASKKNKKKR